MDHLERVLPCGRVWHVWLLATAGTYARFAVRNQTESLARVTVICGALFLCLCAILAELTPTDLADLATTTGPSEGDTAATHVCGRVLIFRAFAAQLLSYLPVNPGMFGRRHAALVAVAGVLLADPMDLQANNSLYEYCQDSTVVWAGSAVLSKLLSILNLLVPIKEMLQAYTVVARFHDNIDG